MKKFHFMRLVLISLLLLSCLVFAACESGNVENNGQAVASISISNSAKPQTVFPQGKDLDLSKGTLTVTYESGRKEDIALNAEGVTVTGYDKNTLGDQSLMITYGGKSINLTINVAKRMTFSGYETNYFVGDTLNLAKGKVTIVKDDGTLVNARLNESSISVVSFDSASAGKGKLATIRYSADGAEYTDTLAVNVYEVGTIKFVKPTKSVYGSHDTELNLQGGYFTLTAKDNDELTKHVELSQDMVSGFDASLTTRDNIDVALNQTISVNYAGQSYSYDIRIFYSGVSITMDAIENLKHVVLGGEDTHISDEDGAIAREGVEAYMGLAPTDRSLLNQGEVNRVARIFATYAREHSNQLGAAVANAVIFYDDNVSLATQNTYEDVEAALAYLSDPECELVLFHAFLADFVHIFQYVKMDSDTTIAEYLYVYPVELFDSLVDGMQFMLDIHNYVSAVPEEWVAIDLIANQKSLDAAITRITTYTNRAMIHNMCGIVSQWRTNNDFVEIIYAYYYYYFRGMMMDDIGYVIPFPGRLQELYNLISVAANLSMAVESAGMEALWYDNTAFLYYYSQIQEIVKDIEDDENRLYFGLYNFLDFEGLIKQYVLYPTVGIVNMMGGSYGDEQVTAMLDDYLALVGKTMIGEDPVFNFEEYKAEYQNVLDQFVNLTPRRQTHFLSTLHNMYGVESVRDTMVTDYTENPARGIFTYMLENYFVTFLSEATIPMAQDMLLAMEYYMNRDFYEGYLDLFYAKMDELTASYNKLTAKDQALFDEYLGKAYTKYSLLYSLEKNGATIDQELYANQFSELVQVYHVFEDLINNLRDPETSQMDDGALGTAIAAFSYAKKLANELLASEEQEIVLLYCVLDMTWQDDYKFDLDYLYMNIRLFLVRLLHDIRFTQYKEDGTEGMVYGWEVYTDADVDELMAAGYHMMLQTHQGETEYDVEMVMELMQIFRDTLVADQRAVYIFNALGGGAIYYEGIENFYNQVLSESNKAIGAKLLEVEKAYCNYVSNKSSDRLIKLMVAISELQSLRNTVTDTENFDTYLAEMYDFYIEQYNNIDFENADLGFGTDF